MGLIDASEATDTYGSPFNAVRGFCAGDWPGMHCALPAAHTLPVPLSLRCDGIGGPEEHASPSVSSFVTDVLPTLQVGVWDVRGPFKESAGASTHLPLPLPLVSLATA
jgi:hypothetical protein